MILKKNPYLFTRKLTEQFTYIANLSTSDGGRLINAKQADFLDAVDGFKSLEQIAHELNTDLSNLIKTVRLLENDGIIGGENGFQQPIFPTPKTMSLWLQTTNVCNLQCKYCYISTVGLHETMQDETMQQLRDNILLTVEQKGLKTVSLRLSGGECLLVIKKWERFLIDLRSKLEKLNCSLCVAAITNLTFIDKDIIRIVKELSISISCSLDGSGQFNDLNRCYRNGAGTYEDVIKNIDELTALEIYPAILTVVNNDNVEGLLAFTKILMERKVRFRFSLVQDFNVDYIKIKSYLHSLYNYLSEEIEAGYPVMRFHTLNNITLKGVLHNPCGMGINSASIYVDGGIYLCQVDFGVRKPIGTISQGVSILDLITKHENNYFDFEGLKCDTCIYRYKCAGACPRRTDKKEMCDFNNEFIPVLLKMQGTQGLYEYQHNT